MSEMDKITWSVLYSRDGKYQCCIYYREDLSFVWQAYKTSTNVTWVKDSRSHFE